MFKRIPKKYGVDFTADIPHFYSLQYTEGSHVLNVEIDFREPIIYLSKSLITSWEPPYHNELIDNQKREEIFSNIYKYLTEIRKFKKVIVVD